MALKFEIGTGLPDADSYASVSVADAFNESRGYPDWASVDDNLKEAYLRRGTTLIENTYGYRFSGRQYSQTQALSWPRYGARDSNGFYIPANSIPNKVVQSTIILARLLSEGVELELVQERGGDITGTSITVGPIKESVTYGDSATPRTTVSLVDGLLMSLLGGASSSLQTELVRG